MAEIDRVLQSAGVPVAFPPHARVRRGWVGADCPRCSPGHGKFRLGFELGTLRAHCWVCGSFYGPTILAQLLKISIAEAHRLYGKTDRRKAADIDQLPHTLKLPDGVQPMLPGHRDYLRDERGLDPDEIERVWGVQGIAFAPKRPNYCLFIPIYDEFGRFVSWTTRTIGKEASSRYFAAPPDCEAIPHKSLLYGEHLCRHTIVIQEGCIDSWTIGPGAVATLGVSYSAQQKNRMAKYPIRLVNFDSQDDAQRRACELCEELASLPGITENIVWETGKDANSAERAEVDEFRRKYFPELYRAS